MELGATDGHHRNATWIGAASGAARVKIAACDNGQAAPAAQSSQAWRRAAGCSARLSPAVLLSGICREGLSGAAAAIAPAPDEMLV